MKYKNIQLVSWTTMGYVWGYPMEKRRRYRKAQAQETPEQSAKRQTLTWLARYGTK